MPRCLEYHPGLQCGLVRVEVRRRTVTFYFPPDECCDMSGAIALARAINPDVRAILTRAGDEADTTFCLEAGQWIALWPERLTRTPTTPRAQLGAPNAAPTTSNGRDGPED